MFTQVTVTDLDHLIERQAHASYFGLSAEKMFTGRKERFSVSRHLAENCMAWIWYQWLKGSPRRAIQKQVTVFIERAMTLYCNRQETYARELHDLYLLHCAFFTRSPVETALLSHASFAQTSGGEERFVQAWCGMLGFYARGRLDDAQSQAELMWKSSKPRHLRLPPKALVVAWLDQDWERFAREQRKVFDKLWARLEKDGGVVRKSATRATVELAVQPARLCSAWADNCLAILAHRRGAEAATDVLWFPQCALES